MNYLAASPSMLLGEMVDPDWDMFGPHKIICPVVCPPSAAADETGNAGETLVWLKYHTKTCTAQYNDHIVLCPEKTK